MASNYSTINFPKLWTEVLESLCDGSLDARKNLKWAAEDILKTEILHLPFVKNIMCILIPFVSSFFSVYFVYID